MTAVIVAVAPCGCVRIALVKEGATFSEIGSLYMRAARRGYEVRETSEVVRMGECDACREPARTSILRPRA